MNTNKQSSPTVGAPQRIDHTIVEIRGEQFVPIKAAREVQHRLDQAMIENARACESYEGMNHAYQQACDALTAALDEKREVVTENERLKTLHAELCAKYSQRTIELEREVMAAYGGDRSRLALAEEILTRVENNLTIMAPDGDALAIVRRWAESRTAEAPTTECLQGQPGDACQHKFCALSEPASRAIPITPETVVPFPCWLWDSGLELWQKANFGPNTGNGEALADCYTFYHPDQLTPPTSRPTAREQQ